MKEGEEEEEEQEGRRRVKNERLRVKKKVSLAGNQRRERDENEEEEEEEEAYASEAMKGKRREKLPSVFQRLCELRLPSRLLLLGKNLGLSAGERRKEVERGDSEEGET